MDNLNPGITKTVLFLREHGFQTTDSGDGITNIAAGMECAIPIPNVFMVVEPSKMVQEADRLYNLLSPILTYPSTLEEALDPGSAYPSIQASYDPTNQIAVLELLNVDDELLSTLPR